MVRSMKLIDIFFPQNIKCIICGKEDNEYGICDDRYSKLPFIKGIVCKKCGTNVKNGDVCIECKGNNLEFERTFAIFDYEGKIRRTILDLKQNGEKYLAKPLSIVIVDYLEDLDMKFDMIIPMPIHTARRKERGFNQCELLLEEVKSRFGNVYEDVLIRHKDTPHQTGLNRDNRKNNLQDAFKVKDKSKIKGKTVLVFDDIYTTGTSMNECARTLKKSGAGKVYGLCLARTPIMKSTYLDVSEKDYIDIMITRNII